MCIEASQVLPSILIVLTDEKPSLRASALSLLSCISEQSPYSVEPIQYQVLEHLTATLMRDVDVECRRGAVLAVHAILRGYQRCGITSLSNNSGAGAAIRQMIGVVADSDQDLITRDHAVSLLNFWNL